MQTCWNVLKRFDLHIYQNNRHAKPDFMVKVPDLYDRRRRRRGRKRPCRHHPRPQGPPNLYLYIVGALFDLCYQTPPRPLLALKG